MRNVKIFTVLILALMTVFTVVNKKQAKGVATGVIGIPVVQEVKETEINYNVDVVRKPVELNSRILSDEEIEEIKAEILVNKSKAENKREKREVVVTVSRSEALGRSTNMKVPSSQGIKSYMGYKAITNTKSKQYKLQRIEDVYTDEHGFRRYGDYYFIALGTYYTKDIGTIFSITLDNGTTFQAIVGDIKSDSHTDKHNQKHAIDGSVIEFIVDSEKLNKEVKESGDVSKLPSKQFEGKVINIAKLGKLGSND